MWNMKVTLLNALILTILKSGETSFSPNHFLAENQALHPHVIYVPVCSPQCYKAQPSCPEKAFLGSLPLQDHGQTYHPHLDVGHHQLGAELYQQKDQHYSGFGQNIEHGPGKSHQNFKEALHHDDGHYEEHHHDHHHKKNVHYRYEYAVNDHKTGDVKRHREERKGDVVNGEYSLLEKDGNVRTVKYQADWKTGFHAQIHNTKPR